MTPSSFYQNSRFMGHPGPPGARQRCIPRRGEEYHGEAIESWQRANRLQGEGELRVRIALCPLKLHFGELLSILRVAIKMPKVKRSNGDDFSAD
jgi:hypothetical protein